MKAQLKNTQMVEIELPEYFSYTRWEITHYCRVMGDKITDVTTDVFTRSATNLVSDLTTVDIADFTEITKLEFRSKLNEIIETVIAV